MTLKYSSAELWDLKIQKFLSLKKSELKIVYVYVSNCWIFQKVISFFFGIIISERSEKLPKEEQCFTLLCEYWILAKKMAVLSFPLNFPNMINKTFFSSILRMLHLSDALLRFSFSDSSNYEVIEWNKRQSESPPCVWQGQYFSFIFLWFLSIFAFGLPRKQCPYL